MGRKATERFNSPPWQTRAMRQKTAGRIMRYHLQNTPHSYLLLFFIFILLANLPSIITPLDELSYNLQELNLLFLNSLAAEVLRV
jgi:hypothetical protein